MSTPPESANDRRAVPRNIRDGEHDLLEESMTGYSKDSPPRSGAVRIAIWLAVLLAAAAGLWLVLR